jgi:hypothetical protein
MRRSEVRQSSKVNDLQCSDEADCSFSKATHRVEHFEHIGELVASIAISVVDMLWLYHIRFRCQRGAPACLLLTATDDEWLLAPLISAQSHTAVKSKLS